MPILTDQPRCGRLALAVVVLAMGASPAGAQPEQPADAGRGPSVGPAPDADHPLAKPAPPPIDISLRVHGRVTLQNDFGDDSPGNVSIYRTGARVGLGRAWGDLGRVDLSFSGEYSHYEFDGATGFGGGSEPFKNVTEYTLAGRIGRQMGDGWTLLGGGGVTLAGEVQADYTEAILATLFLGFQYELRHDLTLGTGLGLRSRLEDDPFVFPLLLIDWTINDHWSLSNINGTGLVLSYRPNDALTFSLDAAWEYHEFRLDSGGTNPEGAVVDQRLPVALGVTWQPGPRGAIRGRVGYDLFQEFTVYDRTGLDFADIQTDPALFFGLDVTLRF